MSITILIDLDDTLLSNSMDTFIPAYIGGLGKFLGNRIKPELTAQTLLSATQKMFENTRPDRTLKETFDPAFYPVLGVTESEMREPIDQFYSHDFSKIKNLTQTRPKAINLIKSFIERDYTIGIATNPLFPRTATMQRLSWADLPAENNQYGLVSSYEDFHYAKPNPAYYAEFLAKLGWPRGQVVMIGHDPVHDIEGASGLGLATFWISDQSADFDKTAPTRHATGNLDDVIPWLDSLPEQDLLPQLSEPSALIAMLRGISAAIDSLLRNRLTDVWLQRPHGDAWSLTEIMCHLRDVEREINIPRLHQVLHENNPFITGIDSDPWAKERNYQLQNGPQALRDFLSARIETLDILVTLSNEDWQRHVQHTILGPTHLQEIISIIAQHDRLHLRQIFSNLG
ncbi:MAG: HAD hydrolase-like protein [Chloroflexi bacterium]|nr:HAD hydrolase-like protein [Chloroflexota bacterium]